MNRNQWFVLSIVFWLLMFVFISIDFTFQCDMLSGITLDQYDIWCIVNSEIYDPFIYIFAALGITFLICGFLEPKRKK